jgi:hypothetical protein
MVFHKMVIVFPKIAIVFLEIHIVTCKFRLWINFSINSFNPVEIMWYYWASDFLTLIKVIFRFHAYVLPGFIMKSNERSKRR